MKISKKDFEELKGNYDHQVRSGKPGKNEKGDIDHQTDWIFFDRATIEKLLEAADKDPEKGGIKFYFCEYTQELSKKYYAKDPEAYDGMLTLVLTAANIEGDEIKDIGFMTRGGDEEDFENHGRQCPPYCKPTI
jgi:hypothetical protein